MGTTTSVVGAFNLQSRPSMGHPSHRLPLCAPQRTHPPRVSPAPRQNPSASLAAAELVLRAADSVGDDEERAEAGFIAAASLYKDCHWEFAFDRLTALADDGHAPAAKLSLLMLRYGRSLYGTSFSAGPEQIARWAQRVLRASSRATASPSSMTASA
jgi:hypothetical protein